MTITILMTTSASSEENFGKIITTIIEEFIFCVLGSLPSRANES